MLEKLSKSDIIGLIGKDLYEQITEFIDAVNVGANEDANLQIYTKKNMLRLLLSFASSTKLVSPTFWRHTLDNLDEAERSGLEEEIEITKNTKGEDLVQKCLHYEFNKYDLSIDSLTENGTKREAIGTCYAPAIPFKPLKNYQIDIYNKALKNLSIPRNRFIIQMPTGSGKTRTAMEIIAGHFNTSNHQKDVLWLAHSVDLIDQAADSFAELWSHIGTFDIDLRISDGLRKGFDCVGNNRSFVASTFQSLISLFNKDKVLQKEILHRFSVVVVDEAHMSLAPTYKDLIHKLLSEGAALIGLTATPGREAEDQKENQRLADFYFQNVISLQAPQQMTVFEYLRDTGVMSRTRVETLKGTEVELTSNQLKEIQKHFSIPKRLLEQFGKDQLRNIEIIVRLKNLVSNQPNCRIILFACSVEHSKFIVSVCNYLGIDAAHIDGTTPPNRRHSVLNNFRDGLIRLLSNYGVLSTGFDAPKTDVVFIARPTASIVLYSQMIGRGLRGPMLGGTKNCLIINVKDNLVGLPDPDEIYDYFQMYYE